jgi:hypothetical protein
VDLVVSLVQDDPAYPAVISAKRDSKLELADAPFPEAKRAPNSPPARRRPLLEPQLVGFRIKLDDGSTGPVGRPPLPPAERPLLRRIPGPIVPASAAHAPILGDRKSRAGPKERVFTLPMLNWNCAVADGLRAASRRLEGCDFGCKATRSQFDRAQPREDARIWLWRSSNRGTSSASTRPIPHSVQIPQWRAPPGELINAASMFSICSAVVPGAWSSGW